MARQVEWRESGLHADHVLTMIATVLIDRAGGQITLTRREWDEINERYDGQGAVIFRAAETNDGSGADSYDAWIGTLGEAAQNGAIERKEH